MESLRADKAIAEASALFLAQTIIATAQDTDVGTMMKHITGRQHEFLHSLWPQFGRLQNEKFTSLVEEWEAIMGIKIGSPEYAALIARAEAITKKDDVCPQ